MKQVRPLPLTAQWNKPALKRTYKNPFDTVFRGSAAFKAAGSGLRTRSVGGMAAKFRSSAHA